MTGSLCLPSKLQGLCQPRTHSGFTKWSRPDPSDSEVITLDEATPHATELLGARAQNDFAVAYLHRADVVGVSLIGKILAQVSGTIFPI